MSDRSETVYSAGTGSLLEPFLVATVPLVGLATLQGAVLVFAPLLMQAAGMRPEAFGWVAGALGLGSAWLYMGNSAFTISLGPVRALQIAALVATAGALLVMTGNFALIAIGGFLVGFGYAATTPSGSQILADNTPSRYRGTLFSLRQAGVPLGGIIAGAAGGWLVAYAGLQTALGVIVAIAVALCLALAVTPRHYNETRPLRPFQPAGLFAVTNLVQPFKTVGAITGLTRLVLACIGFAAVQGVTIAFFVTYMTAGLGFSLALAGTLFATMQTASVAGRIVLGFVADRVGSPRSVLTALAVLSCLSSLLMALVQPDWTSVQLFAVALFSGLSVATWNGLYLAEVTSMAPDNVSEATAGTTFFVFSTYTLTPPIAGLIITVFGYRAVFVIVAFAAATSAVILKTTAAAAVEQS